MSDQCQYHRCTESYDGILDTHFGERSYCTTHYTMMVQALEQKPEVIEGPTDNAN